MRYWTIHTSVLEDSVCTLPGSGYVSCTEFIEWIKGKGNEGVALDNNRIIITEYKNLQKDRSMRVSGIVGGFLKSILTTHNKSLPFSSELQSNHETTLKNNGANEKDLIYFGVAANSNKVFAHSKNFTNAINNSVEQLLGVKIHYVPDKTWRTL